MQARPRISLTAASLDRYDPTGPMRPSQAGLLPRRTLLRALAAVLHRRQDSKNTRVQSSPELMFPDSDHFPAAGTIVTRNSDIAGAVPFQLSEPELSSRPWGATVPVAMVPKAGVYEDHDPGLAHHEIRSPFHVAGVGPIANAGCPKRSPKLDFDSGIAGPNAGHDPTASLSRNGVHSCTSLALSV
jgi:hypothetical protein